MKTRNFAPFMVLLAAGAGGFAYEYGLHRAPPTWFIILAFFCLLFSSE